MKDKKIGFITLSVAAMLVLILDTKTALRGASEGMELCIKTVIPSLFPFFFISKIIISSANKLSWKLLRPIGKLCRIPAGSEIIFLLGILGGYPVGAQLIETAVAQGSLSKEDGCRMMGFCNNPGPAFIFGITGLLFEEPYIPWILWGILIFSALLTGMLLPGESQSVSGKIQIPKANYMTDSLKSMASVCGWIILFRTLLNILSRWFLWLLPIPWQVLLTGILELSNGCLGLFAVENPANRLIFAAIILSAGGLCVAMQTVSVSPSLNHKTYFIGKAIQTVLTIPLSQIATMIIFKDNISLLYGILFIVCILLLIPILIFRRKYISKQKSFDKAISV